MSDSPKESFDSDVDSGLAMDSPSRKRVTCSSGETQRLLEIKPSSAMAETSTQDKARDVLMDLKDIKSAQFQITDQLDRIRRENNVLYDDMSWVREKMTQQQVVVNKLLHFLMTMVGGRRTFLKRTFPYLLEDSEIVEKKANQLQYIKTDDREVDLDEWVAVSKKNPAVVLPELTYTPIEAVTKANAMTSNKSDGGSSVSSACSNSLIKADVVTDAPAKVKAELQELSAELQEDIQSLREVLTSESGMGIPIATVNKLFDSETSTVPVVPSDLMTVKPEDKIADGPVPIAAVVGDVLEEKQIKQQELVDVACAVAQEAVGVAEGEPAASK